MDGVVRRSLSVRRLSVELVGVRVSWRCVHPRVCSLGLHPSGMGGREWQVTQRLP